MAGSTFDPGSLQALESVTIGGLPTVRATRSQLAERMMADCMKARAGTAEAPALVFSSNGEGVALAGRSPQFARDIAAADFIHADGMSVVIASRLSGRPLPERICTTDFFHDAARVAARDGLSFYFFGGTEDQNRRAVAAVRARYPQLRIAGRRNGYFDPAENDAICEDMRASEADVVWVALGRPLQERWCVANRAKLTGVGWLKTCGGLYSFLSGDAPRAPLWMQKASIEWLHRAASDPKRLLLRYLTTNPRALLRLVTLTERPGGLGNAARTRMTTE